MISIILVAELLSRKSNIYNSILFSAFVLLIINPNLLFSVSFQLSYSAVFGIVFLYNKIYRLIYVKSKVIDFFWKISALSVSAQLATFPITIYYFHQFPTLSLITNLLAIPSATLVIFGSLLLLATSILGFIPELIGKLIESWIFFYNEIMLFISSFNMALISDLHPKIEIAILLIFGMLMLAGFIETRRLYFFKFLTIILVLITVVKFCDHYT